MSAGRLKVLMLGWEYPPIMAGGLGTACYGLCNALKAHADITLVLPKSSAAMVQDNLQILGVNQYGLDQAATVEQPPHRWEEIVEEVIEVPGNELHPYPISAVHKRVIEHLEFDLSDDAEVRALYETDEPYGPNIMQKVAVYAEVVSKLALTKDFDIIHAHDWVTYTAGVRIKELTGKPLVVHVHSLETDRIGTQAKYMQANAVYDIERYGMTEANLCIPVSHFTKQCAADHYGIHPDKCRPVYNAIDPEPTYRIDRAEGDKIVLFLGRITFQKGPEYMAETAYKVLQRYPKVVFFVAGIGDQLDQLKHRVQQLGIRDKFVFGGFLKKAQVKQVLAQADVYFMPSVSEPFGLSALEAAQFQIPCVLSTQAGVSEVMDFALKADYWDTDRFANYIYALLNYEGIRQELIEHTTENLEEMSWDRSARDVLAVYHEALTQG